MAQLRKEHRDFIAEEVRQQVSEAIDQFKPRGWKKLTFLLREWGLTAIAITLPTTLLGILVTISIFAVNGVKENAQFRTRTEDRLDRINEELKNIKGDLARQNVTTHASLQPEEFKAALPSLISAMATLRAQNAKIGSKIVDDVAQRLLATDRNAAGFWPAASELVSYRSQVAAPDAARLAQTQLADCTDSAPEITTLTVQGKENEKPIEVKALFAVYRNCRVVLDSPKDANNLNSLLLKGGIAGVRFYQCLVVYQGGPIKLILAWKNQVIFGSHIDISPSGETLYFTDCVLDFSLQASPPLEAQRLTESFLKQSPSDVRLHLAPPA